ncbi:MAG: hypothetical protein M5U19_04110 [Microthrixaceae bacterium]|nr:hypothetical protein [Microthrixaceae bacterium]
MSLFDLAVGDPTVRPTAENGHGAAQAALKSLGPAPWACSVPVRARPSPGWRGVDAMRDAGLVGAVLHDGDLIVAALVAVNAWGDVVGTPEAALPSLRCRVSPERHRLLG